MSNWDGEPAAVEGAPAQAALDSQEIKVFNKWSLHDVEVSDISLVVSYSWSQTGSLLTDFRITSP